MFNMKIQDLVNVFVSQELRGRESEALYLSFDLRMSYYVENDSYNQSCGLHLLYYVRPGFSYISVFSGVTDSSFAKIEDVKSWEHECTHDSCWRDIQIFSLLYFDMARKINNEMRKNGLPQVAPRDMSEHNNFQSFHKMYEWVPVRVTKDPDDKNNYRKIVEVLEKP